uniref:Bmru protein n=1 Tax=Rhizophora mucronata TaxID=61149 RepID=A0A2P2LD30_RHIMU
MAWWHCQLQIASGGGIAKPPLVLRADHYQHHPIASDLSPDCSMLLGGSPSSRRRDLVFIVNPRGLLLSSLLLSSLLCVCSILGLVSC